MEYRVYDSRNNKTLFIGEHFEAIEYITFNYDEDHEDFNFVWIERVI